MIQICWAGTLRMNQHVTDPAEVTRVRAHDIHYVMGCQIAIVAYSWSALA